MPDLAGRLHRGDLPECRGKLTSNHPLAELTWMRVGGPAEWLFQPADTEDLASFLRALDPGIPAFVMGVGSNLIVRDGGIRGVVIRLGRRFAKMEFDGNRVAAGGFALDSRVSLQAAEMGVNLTFLRTIPGTIGGAVKMNAGCYGTYMADVVKETTVVTRGGELQTLGWEKLDFGYRRSGLPEGSVVVEALLECEVGDPPILAQIIEDQVRHRNATQPTKVKTAGSTFRNPAGFSSTGFPGEDHSMKAWKLIDESGMRGVHRGSAQVSTEHPNFLVNTGGTTATELELLGEDVREAVREQFGIMLEWEVIRIGERTLVGS